MTQCVQICANHAAAEPPSAKTSLRDTATLTNRRRCEKSGLEPVVRFPAGAELLTGDADLAIVWFRHQPIAGPDGKTALHLVEGVHADAVLAHFEDLLDGNFE
jgi:hypothetical protein